MSFVFAYVLCLCINMWEPLYASVYPYSFQVKCIQNIYTKSMNFNYTIIFSTRPIKSEILTLLVMLYYRKRQKKVKEAKSLQVHGYFFLKFCSKHKRIDESRWKQHQAGSANDTFLLALSCKSIRSAQSKAWTMENVINGRSWSFNKTFLIPLCPGEEMHLKAGVDNKMNTIRITAKFI